MSKDTRVLVVEDESLVSEMIEGFLEDIGYTVIGRATNGLQAVHMTQALQPDVVLMDIEMPDMHGLEASRRIQKTCPTPVVVLTAYESSALVEWASVVGVGAYLVKPPQRREMERAITIAIARFGDAKDLRRLNAELRQALENVNLLSGLLPICASCKRIRDGQGNWQEIEAYIHDHSEAEFSHGICPDCARKLYPDLADDLF
ncbi:MAG: ANTAR domain-containing response regulator [Anaerolineae bacterium]